MKKRGLITTYNPDQASYEVHMPILYPPPATSSPFMASPQRGSQMLTRMFSQYYKESVMLFFGRLGPIGENFD